MTSKTTPFTFIDQIFWNKEDIYSEETADGYVPFVVNRHLSLFKDTVLYANDLNIHNAAPKYAQYLFYLSSIPKRKRFAKWTKRVENEDLAAISAVYGCNRERAEEYFNLLTAEQLIAIKQQYAEISNVIKSAR